MSYNRFSYTPVDTDGYDDTVLDLKYTEWRTHLKSLDYVTTRAVLQEEANNLPLIAYKEFGTPNLWWVLALCNNLFSPLADLPMGTLLRIPTSESVAQMLAAAIPVQQEATRAPGVVTVRRNIL